MYPPHIQQWMIYAGLLALLALCAQAGGEVLYLAQKDNPFPHSPGLPTILEDPFDPTRSYIDLDLLPWTLDPAQAWPPALQQQALQPCGALAVLAARYPLWAPLGAPAPLPLCAPHDQHEARLKALRGAGWLPEAPGAVGPTRLLLPDGSLLLDQGETWDLAIVPHAGLQMRRRGTP